jgi:hypothetical protein
MRKMTTVAVLAAVVLLLNFVVLQAQQQKNYWIDEGGEGYEMYQQNIENYGFAVGSQPIHFAVNNQTISNLYYGNVRTVTNYYGLTVGTLWVTVDSVRGLENSFRWINASGNEVSIGEVALYVGNMVPFTGARAFGNENAVQVVLNDTIKVGAWAPAASFSVWNESKIEELVYNGGTYVNMNKNASIGTLVAGTSVDKDAGYWGKVDNLAFAESGGLLTIAADANFGFSNDVNAGSYNLKNGNLVLDFTSLALAGTSFEDWTNAFIKAGYSKFSWDDLFGTGEVVGWDALNSLKINWRGDTEDVFTWVDGAQVFAANWSMNNDGFFAVASTSVSNSGTPEPATLAVFGLGLAGLGLAARRVRRSNV